eukprot:TRINITY_DN25257_c0_g1_i1.p1 TRINITY_DN25257_c0_g1~~TRINITY_DN25257_c0_g1_i1.p1  ORF type:complete len:136 (-),score=8.28 TRINITY_DN25257_c0_g1_i1:227-634(-)
MNARIYFILILCSVLLNCSKSSQENNNISVNKKDQISNNLVNERAPAIVKGVLRDHNNQPLPMANIEVQKINDLQRKPLGAATSFSGEYWVRIPVSKDNVNVQMIFTFSSYKADTNLVQVSSGDTLIINHQFELK